MDDEGALATVIIRGHEEFAPARCPACGKERTVSPGVYMCGDCGTWFRALARGDA